MKRVLTGLAVLAVLTGCSDIRPTFERELKEMVKNHGEMRHERISEAEMKALPEILRKYLLQSGFASMEKIRFVHIKYRGRMQLKFGDKYYPIECEQYNSTDLSERLWYGKIQMAPFMAVEGRHIYKNGYAQMLIKLGPITLVDMKGDKASQSDMITYFNDMLLFMPNAVIHSNISWKETGSNELKMLMSNGGYKAEALLQFNTSNELTNFITDDRYALVGTNLCKYRWETPFLGYRVRNGLKEATWGEAVYKYPQGDFHYFIINDTNLFIEYNVVPVVK